MVGKPDAGDVAALRPGQAVIGMLAPLTDPILTAALAEAGVTALSMDMIPRTLPRAQPMDALSSQANIAGYKAALLGGGRVRPVLPAADHRGRDRPAGQGAGARDRRGGAAGHRHGPRLGALVSAYDVRPETKTEAESVGATFIELTSVGPATGEGGYARALTEEERAAQQHELAAHIARHDVVITTAQVPGRRPPLLVTEDALKAMAAGSVIVDMGASALGGNVAGSVPGQTVVTENGVTIIGAAGLPSTHASRRIRDVRAQHQRAAAVPGEGRRAGARPGRRAAGRSRHHLGGASSIRRYARSVRQSPPGARAQPEGGAARVVPGAAR